MNSARRILENLWVATVVFILVATLSSVAISWNGLTPARAAIGLLLGALVATWIGRKNILEDRSHDPNQDGHWFWRSAVAICFCLFAFRVFLWLLYDKRGVICTLLPNNIGDLPLHIQYIRFFSQGAALWPANPFHVHSSIGYPFGIDWFNALLDILGIPLSNALTATGLFCTLITGIALYRWGRSFAVAAFLFSGGMTALAFFSTGEWMNYQDAVDWKNIPLSIFATQRGFLYALPAGILLLVEWRRNHSRLDRPEGSLPFCLEWMIYASMPLFHLHTFLFLSLVLGWLAVFGKNRNRLWLLILASLVPATILVGLLTDGFHAGHALAWQPGWMQGEHFSWSYWWKNFGILPLVLVLLPWLLLRQAKSADAGQVTDAHAGLNFVWPAVLLFAATLFFKFSPWIWDNTKLMMWSYLVAMPWVWMLLVRQEWSVRIVVCGALFFSGFISLWGGLGSQMTGEPLAKRIDVIEVGEAIKNLPVEAVFATSPDYVHPLVFNGRRLAVGYHGHFIGHGVPFKSDHRQMNLLMMGGPGWEKAAEILQVNYLFWGPEEAKKWPKSSRAWTSASELVSQGNWGTIYKLPMQ